jgi:hypothetical protein
LWISAWGTVARLHRDRLGAKLHRHETAPPRNHAAARSYSRQQIRKKAMVSWTARRTRTLTWLVYSFE